MKQIASYVSAVALAVVAVSAGLGVEAPAASADVWSGIRSKTGKFREWKRCWTGPANLRKRFIGIRLKDSGDNNAIRFQIRRGHDVRWESNESITPGHVVNGENVGVDKFYPELWVRADWIVKTALTIKLRLETKPTGPAAG